MTPSLKYPPPGVETAPTSADTVSLRDAARILGRDHRTVKAMITKGTLRGGAEPQPQRLRWYVYRDALPANTTPPSVPQADDLTAVIADQAARIVTLEHNNRLLAGAAEDLLDGFEHYKAGAEASLKAAHHFEAAAAKCSDAVRAYRDALAQHMTPSNISELAGGQPLP